MVHASTTTRKAQASAVKPEIRVSIHLLGQFRLEVDHQDTTRLLTYDKARLLVALLALAQGRSMARIRIAEMLWPDSNPDQGLARVRHALHILRQALAGASEILKADALGLVLAPDRIHVDVLSIVDGDTPTDTSDLSHRLNQYAGPFLGSLKLPHSDLLLAWQQSWNARLEIELAQFRSRLTERLVEDGNHPEALAHAKKWVEQWPEDEVCHRLLIRLLLLAGDRDAALLAFQQCCDTLSQRLGVMPGPETRALINVTALPPVANASGKSGNDTSDGKDLYCYRPMATLGMALSWQFQSPGSGVDDTDEAEQAIASMQYWHDILVGLANEHGAWLPQTGTTTILAYFGYPAVSERPIVQAIRLAQRIARLKPAPGISIGLAIHADVVLTKTALQANASKLLCQRVIPLAWMARPGEILLSQNAAARMADWKLVSVTRGGQSSLRLEECEHTMPTGRIHGRLREFDILVQQWARLHSRETPTMLVLHGLSGLGKTRLVQAMTEYARNVEGVVIELECQENHDSIPLFAFRPWLYQLLGMPDKNNDTTGLDAKTIEQAGTTLQQAFKLTPESASHLISVFVSAEPADREDTCGEAIDALLSLLHAHTRVGQPLLITCDNLQWLDAISRQALGRIVQSPRLSPVMVLATARQPFAAAWPVMNIKLNPLSASAIAEYVTGAGKHTRIPRAVRQEIVSESLGNPLYAREMMHMHQLRLCVDYIPRLADFLAAQLLQRGSAVRDVAYLAALVPELGIHDFSKALGQNSKTFQQALDTLTRLGVLSTDVDKPYTCPAVISRALRRIMMKQDRHRLCNVIARHLIQNRFPASEIAAYLLNANNPDGSQWWYRAIAEAMQEDSLDKAMSLAGRALESGKFIDDPEQRAEFEFGCHWTIGTIATAITGPTAPSTILAYDQAAQSRLATKPEIALADLWGQWVVQHNLGHLDQASHVAQELLRLATNQKHDDWEGWALYALAQYDIWKGNPVKGETLLLQSLALLSQSKGTKSAPSAYGHHSYSLGYAALGLAQALQGKFGTALQNTRHAVHISLQSQSHASTAVCRLHLQRICYLADNLADLKKESKLLLDEQQLESPDNVWRAIARGNVALATALTSPGASQIEVLQQSLHVMEQSMPVAVDGQLCMLARALIAAGRPQDALCRLEEAAAHAGKNRSTLLMPEIHCINGDAWKALHRLDIARDHWATAEAHVRRHGLFAYTHWLNARTVQ